MRCYGNGLLEMLILRRQIMSEHLFERLARERNIMVEEMRAIISARIEKGWNDPDPEKEGSGERYRAMANCLRRMSG